LNNEWVNKQLEVPIQIIISQNPKYTYTSQKDTLLIYPQISKERALGERKQQVDYTCFDYAISKIYESAQGDSLKAFKGFVFFTAIDFNLYGRIFSGFYDKYSVRLDQPDKSTIVDGEGIFGSIYFDSTEILNVLPKP
jgi:hypothetical protein